MKTVDVSMRAITPSHEPGTGIHEATKYQIRYGKRVTEVHTVVANMNASDCS